jgi:hypothetical protein
MDVQSSKRSIHPISGCSDHHFGLGDFNNWKAKVCPRDGLPWRCRALRQRELAHGNRWPSPLLAGSREAVETVG